MTQYEPKDSKSAILARLKRIEGQVRGVQGMINDERDCHEIMQQMSAIKSALHQASLEVMREYAQVCIQEDTWDKQTRERAIDDLIHLIGKNS